METAVMENKKREWIRKYAAKAFDHWCSYEHHIAVSDDYRGKLEMDLAQHYDDPLAREFVEKMWAG